MSSEDKKPLPTTPAVGSATESKPLVSGELLENLQAPELYGSGISSLSVTGSNITMTLASSRFDNSVDPPVRRQVVVARIVISAAAAAELSVALYNFLIKQGFTFKPPGDKRQ